MPASSRTAQRNKWAIDGHDTEKSKNNPPPREQAPHATRCSAVSTSTTGVRMETERRKPNWRGESTAPTNEPNCALRAEAKRFASQLAKDRGRVSDACSASASVIQWRHTVQSSRLAASGAFFQAVYPMLSGPRAATLVRMETSRSHASQGGTRPRANDNASCGPCPPSRRWLESAPGPCLVARPQQSGVSAHPSRSSSCRASPRLRRRPQQHVSRCRKREPSTTAASALVRPR